MGQILHINSYHNIPTQIKGRVLDLVVFLLEDLLTFSTFLVFKSLC